MAGTFAMSLPVEQLVGIGPVSARWLRDAGVLTRGDLATLGSVAAYHKLLDQGVRPNLNLLWALEGALLDLHWTMIPPGRREELKSRLSSHIAS